MFNVSIKLAIYTPILGHYQTPIMVLKLVGPNSNLGIFKNLGF